MTHFQEAPHDSKSARLTLVIPSLRSGGAERVMSILANYWASRGVSITLLTFDDGIEPPFYPLSPLVDHRPLGLSARVMSPLKAVYALISNVRRLRRAIRESTPEAVISFMDTTNVLTLLATAGSGISVVVAERTNPYQYHIASIWRLLRLITYPMAQRISVQTQRSAEYFRPWLNRKLTVIPNPVLLPEIGIEEDFHLDKMTIVSVGRLSPEKGFDLLIEAFSKIHTEHPEWKIALFGSGDSEAELKSQVENLGLQHKVRFPGKTHNPYSIFRKAGIYVSSSRYEGFPNALCEAMASGMPVISTDCPAGPREIITDGVDGILVPNRDIKALAMAMSLLISTPTLREELGKNALLITQRFGIESVTGQWEKMILESCGLSLSIIA